MLQQGSKRVALGELVLWVKGISLLRVFDQGTLILKELDVVGLILAL